MDKSTLEIIIKRKSEKLWSKDFNDLITHIENFFKSRPHFRENDSTYRYADPFRQYLYRDKERVLKNIEEAELQSLLVEISRIKNYLSEEINE